MIIENLTEEDYRSILYYLKTYRIAVTQLANDNVPFKIDTIISKISDSLLKQ